MHPLFSRILSVPIRAKVLAAVAVACVVALLVGVLGLVQLSNLQQRTADVQAQGLVPTGQLAAVRRAFLQTRIDAVADELVPGASDQGPEHTAFLADVDTMNAAITTYANGSRLTDAQRADVAALKDAWGKYQTARANSLVLIRRGLAAQYIAYRNANSKPAAAALNEALTKLEKSAADQAAATVADAQSTYRSARTALLVVLVIGLAAAVATPVMLAAIWLLPAAASETLRFISAVVAPCSSTAESIVVW